MAKKISQLTQATQVKSDDVTVIVQDGETKKLPLNMMVTKQDIENKKVAGLAKLDEIEATYENDTYTPTIAVKNKSSVKVGEGDGVDYSANVMDGPAKSAILSGQTLVNLTNSDKTDKRKLLLSARLRNLMPNLKINKNLDEKNNLSIIYKNNIPSQVINPLAFDDFNRTYNTSSYYQKLFKQSSKQQFVLNLRIQDSKSQSQRKQNTKIRLNGRNHSYVNNNRNRGKKQFYINK